VLLFHVVVVVLLVPCSTTHVEWVSPSNQQRYNNYYCIFPNNILGNIVHIWGVQNLLELDNIKEVAPWSSEFP
jgi:hypothetical protein